MSTTSVSILMPVKNADKWLQECLNSILAQNYTDWELIAINDHSTDNSHKILELAAKADPRIKQFSNDGDGIIDALNLALSHSSAEYITRMDADDVMPPDKLRLLYEGCNQKLDTVATGHVKYFSAKPISDGYMEYEGWLNTRCTQSDHWSWVYRECVIASANWMTHKSQVMFEKNVYPEDYNLVFNWYSKDVKINAVNEVTHLWREHPDRTSRNSENYNQQTFFELKLSRFIEHDYDSNRALSVMGNNKKSKLIMNWLKANNIKHEQVTLDHLNRIAEIDHPQVLVGVFPAIELRDGITDFLGAFSLEMGSDWWWF